MSDFRAMNKPSEIIRVLLIEDNPGDARLVREMLVETGTNRFNLEHVERISQGLTRLSQEDFQVILLDLSLPDGHGLETVDQVCNVAPHIPVLVLTGLDDETLAIRAVQEGAQDYLVKGRMDGNLLMRAIRYATERKRAEETLRESERHWSKTFDAINDAICLIDPDGRILKHNQATQRLLGKSASELNGQFCFEVVHGSSQPIAGCPIVRIKETKRRERATLQLGSRWLEITTDPILDNDQRIEAAVYIMEDITERRRAEEEIAALQEQFHQSQKMESIGRLAGGIAHDFNNLLTVIKGYSQLSLIELKEGDPLRGNLEEIKSATDKASDLIRQLLAFGRRQILELKVLDLNTALRNLEKMLRRVIGEDIELVMHFPEDLGGVKTDPGQIEQVFMNLAVNAKDAMPSGGKLIIETANVELGEEYARNHVAVTPGRYVMLSVSDTGVGMTPEVKKQALEPFFTTKKKGEGTGLGLSTVYGIVKQSGGNIWVYSEPGKGTTFKIYLPRVDEPLEELGERVEVKEIPRGTETILVVEDEEDVRKLAVRILERQGYKVLEASQGLDAFLIAEKYEDLIHLLVTDVVMPKISGRELADRIAEIRPEIKVLYMSGYTDNAIAHHGILEKGTNFMQKPFTVDGLARKVREVLDK